MFNRIRKTPTERVETFIGANSTFSGTLICDGNVRVDGVCEEGLIKTLGNIIISPEAKVGSDLEAENVSVSGSVTGNITATGRLEVLSSGKIWGDVQVGSFLLDDDAFFTGKLVMLSAPERPDFHQSAPPPADDDDDTSDDEASAIDVDDTVSGDSPSKREG